MHMFLVLWLTQRFSWKGFNARYFSTRRPPSYYINPEIMYMSIQFFSFFFFFSFLFDTQTHSCSQTCRYLKFPHRWVEIVISLRTTFKYDNQIWWRTVKQRHQMSKKQKISKIKVLRANNNNEWNSFFEEHSIQTNKQAKL